LSFYALVLQIWGGEFTTPIGRGDFCGWKPDGVGSSIDQMIDVSSKGAGTILLT